MSDTNPKDSFDSKRENGLKVISAILPAAVSFIFEISTGVVEPVKIYFPN